MGRGFRSEIMDEWVTDAEYDEYLKVWCQYHRLCEMFDRTITSDGRPRDYRDTAIMSRNAREIKKTTTDLVPVKDKEKWQRAKMEAIRIIEKEFI